MNKYPKRLIEVDLPIKRISAHSRREKSIRHGHISTLHIWWARRPLAACRAVLCASLWPDPADDLCPDSFRKKARKLMQQWADKHLKLLSAESFPQFISYQKNINKLKDDKELRKAMLDFIADFADWDNSTVKKYLETSRALTQAAHDALGGEPGTRPLVVDPFAGGGAIPLEALRVGADVFASDLNPVAVLLNKVVLEYVPKCGQKLADEVRKWGQWVKEQAKKELSQFYPKDEDGATPIAYLWARTIQCEGPSCGATVPLIRSLWLAKKSNKSVAVQMVPNQKEKRVDFEIIKKHDNGRWYKQNTNTVVDKPKFDGTVARGSATCPCCGFTTPVTSTRSQLKKRRGGTHDAQLYAVCLSFPNNRGRYFRAPTENDYAAITNASDYVITKKSETIRGFSLFPDEPTPEGKGSGAGRAFSQRNYGMTVFSDIYTPRQLLTMATFAKVNKSCPCNEEIRLLLALALGRVNDLCMSLCRWLPTLSAIAAANGGQNRMPVNLDFVEANTLADAGGSWSGQLEWIIRVIKNLDEANLTSGTVERSAAQELPLPDNSADALITDPPYYDAFPYSDLSDYFYIWLKRVIRQDVLNYHSLLVPKDKEIVVYNVIHGSDGILKDSNYFENQMKIAFTQGRKVVKPHGISVVVFANKTTTGWESLVNGLINAGWIVTGSWPIDTERPNRQRAIDSAALTSSVHLVCRPRENEDGSLREDYIGDWRDVLQELPKRIHEWMPRLAEEGVVGADAIFACLGPALEVFSRYSKVEKASGEEVILREYLEHVWAAVAKEALNMIFEGADTAGFEEDSRLTAMWLWTLSAGANGNGQRETADEKTAKSVGYTLEFDAARKIAQGLGAHLEKLGRMVEIKGDKARLLSVAERNKYLFGKDESQAPAGRRKKKDSQMQLDFMAEVQKAEREEGGWGEKSAPRAGETVLDQLHQAMILFAAGRGEAMKRFLVEEGIGRDGRFWRLAQAFSALYPSGTDEKRWVDGVLARKKGLGF